VNFRLLELVGGQNLHRAVHFFSAQYKTGIAGVKRNSGAATRIAATSEIRKYP
jgi:hypothetical protein